jgi:hypothetical protein
MAFIKPQIKSLNKSRARIFYHTLVLTLKHLKRYLIIKLTLLLETMFLLSVSIGITFSSKLKRQEF